MSSASGLAPVEHAAFAVSSRLISCFVTEGILQGVYVPWKNDACGMAGLMLVMTGSQWNSSASLPKTENIFVLVPLHHAPVLQQGLSKFGFGFDIGLVDPMDMIPSIYGFVEDVTNHLNTALADTIIHCLASPPLDLTKKGKLRLVGSPLYLWNQFSAFHPLERQLEEAIGLEIQSSFDWQVISYQNPPVCPSLDSPAIAWEQSLVAGHPTHPMHRARSLPSGKLDYDWYHPVLRFARVPKTAMSLYGDFEQLGYQLASLAAGRAGLALTLESTHVYVPIHELQISNIPSKFPDIEILDPTVSLVALAQSSIRTVILPELPGRALKLSVGVKISSALRTISHFTADFGPRFSAQVVPRLAIDPKILHIELETSTAIYRSDDPDKAKHFTAVIRDEYQPADGEIVIVAATLLEMDLSGLPVGVPVVQHIFSLDTAEKRSVFLERYIMIGCQALLPALIQNGVAFEAHAQNILVRFDKQSGLLKGFVFRDLGGLRVHPQTLRESTGVDFQFLPGHCVAALTLPEIYPKFYHTFVHNHIQRLIRVLGMHYNGEGWDILRRHMCSVIPQQHPLWKLWLDGDSRSVQSKCLMRMRMQDSYRDMVYNPYPNMIQYRPEPQLLTKKPSPAKSLLLPYFSKFLKTFRDYLYI